MGDGLLRDATYKFPEVIEDIRGFVDSSEDFELEILRITYDDLIHMIGKGFTIKSVDWLMVELDDVDLAFISRYKVKDLVCKISKPCLEPEAISRVNIPASFEIRPPFNDYTYLPQNLTSLSLFSSWLDDDLDMRWLRNLETLLFRIYQKLTNQKIFLPENLEMLDLAVLDPSSKFSIDCLPSNLQSLRLHQVEIPPCFQLPLSLSDIFLSSTRVDCKYPEGLEAAEFSCDANAEDYGAFPTSLRRLVINDQLIRLPDISNLVNLETFEAGYRKMNEGSLGSEPIIVLPENVMYLRTFNDNHCFKFNKHLKHMKMYLGRNSKTMSMNSFPEGLEALELEVFDPEILENLPSTIKVLSVDRGVPLSDRKLRLPPSLDLLEIKSCGIETIIFNKGLRYLHLKQCDIPQGFVDQVPKYLVTFAMIDCRCDKGMDLSGFRFKHMKFYDCSVEEQIILPSTLKTLDIQDMGVPEVYEGLDFTFVGPFGLYGENIETPRIYM
ncbi:hypothetical protein CLIB1444_05S07250 [[Candida] jaroonii]|uniref:Uncharacterized protein n=1 Tax=[Candida] jaroonii TaxID=467808 RepID=A0ACA9Y8F2_9ASCO|nr:hypothetical protein CLIB1444_05S07250 [[Candida] jaroonii]